MTDISRPQVPGAARRSRPRLAVVGAGLVIALAAAGCSSASVSTAPGASPASPAAAGSAPASAGSSQLAALLPASVRKAGVITAVTSPYAPSEILGANGKFTGWETQLTNSIAQVLGLRVAYSNAANDANIPGIQSGRWEISPGSWGVTPQREKIVDFVTDFDGGDQFFVNASSNLNIQQKSDLCGLTVGVEIGTTEQDAADAEQAQCKSLGKSPIQIKVFPSQDEINLAVAGNRIQVSYTASEVSEYIAKQQPGKLKLEGKLLDAAPYGIIVSQKLPGLAQAMAAALNMLIKNGTYARILKAWGVSDGAISQAVVQPASAR